MTVTVPPRHGVHALRPGAQGHTTSTGARAVAVIRCDHGATVRGGGVYATAAYAERPYGFDVVTRSAQDVPVEFGAMRLLPAPSLPA